LVITKTPETDFGIDGLQGVAFLEVRGEYPLSHHHMPYQDVNQYVPVFPDCGISWYRGQGGKRG
jgi:hypothetical protein